MSYTLYIFFLPFLLILSYLLEPLIICLAVRLVGGLNDCGMPTTESQSEAAVQHREDRGRDGKQPPTPCPSTLRSREVSHNTAYTAAHHGEMDAGT